MRIGIDVDGVLADTLHAILSQLNSSWDITKGWYGGLSAEDYDAVWEKAKGIENFWAGMGSLLDTETISVLRAVILTHDVWFITNRFETLGASPLKQTKFWLYAEAEVQSPNVVIAKDKGPVAAVLNLDAFVDDNPINCTDVLAARPNAHVFLADAAHNQTFKDERIPRVKDLKEFLKLILSEVF